MESERKEKEIYHVPMWLGQARARRLEHYLGLPHSWQGSKHLGHDHNANSCTFSVPGLDWGLSHEVMWNFPPVTLYQYLRNLDLGSRCLVQWWGYHLGCHASHAEEHVFKSQLCSWFQFLINAYLRGRRGQVKRLGSCHLHGRPWLN